MDEDGQAATLTDRSAERPVPPDPMTVPCRDFFLDYHEVGSHLGFVASMATHVDEMRRIAAEALGSEGAEPEISDKGSALAELRRQRQLLLQMLLTRVADAYLHYVSALLVLVFRSRPETLRTAQLVRLDFVLDFQDMEELIAALAERRVTDLAYQSMSKLAEDLQQRLSLPLFTSEPDLTRAIRIVEMRNLIVHNRAVINRRFLSQVRDFDGDEGDRLKLTVDILDEADLLAESAAALDQRAVEKFGLPALIRRQEIDDAVLG
jgi:hypothetical protein